MPRVCGSGWDKAVLDGQLEVFDTLAELAPRHPHLQAESARCRSQGGGHLSACTGNCRAVESAPETGGLRPRPPVGRLGGATDRPMCRPVAPTPGPGTMGANPASATH